jgi:hypothetical protein
MGKTKKDIRIIKKDSNKEDYTFVSINILNDVNNIKNNPSAKITNNANIENKPNERMEKKIHTKKVDNKGRKILGKSLQGHSPIYE